MFGTALLASPAEPQINRPTLRENPYEKAHSRFRARHSFRRARFGRRLPKLLHDALVRAEIDASLRLSPSFPLGTGSQACAHFLIGVVAVRGGRQPRVRGGLAILVFCLHDLWRGNLPVVCLGPSSNTWPRCEAHPAHTTSVRCVPWLVSSTYFTAPGKAWSKLGQPVPESNLASEENTGYRRRNRHTLPSAFHEGIRRIFHSENLILLRSENLLPFFFALGHRIIAHGKWSSRSHLSLCLA
jgi:hypothetical protein